MTDKQISIKLEIKNRKVRDDLEQVIRSIQGYEILADENSHICDLLILEVTGEDMAQEFRYIQSVKSSGAARNIFITSMIVEPDFLIRAMRAGAKEFFHQPTRREEIRESLLKFREEQAKAVLKGRQEKCKQGRIISVFGSKGGVGTTTVAVNLAASIAEADAGKSVALIDMNLLFGEVPLFLDMEHTFNWAEIIKNIARLDAMYLMSIMATHPSGLHVLPSPSSMEGGNTATPQVVEQILRLMQTVFDYIIIDGGHSPDAISFQLLRQSHEVIIVAILSLPCLVNVKRLFGTFQRLGYPHKDNIKVVINRYHKKSDISIQEAEESIKTKISWTLPNDYSTTVSAINQGKTLSAYAPKSEICKGIQDISRAILKEQPIIVPEPAKERASGSSILRSFFLGLMS